MENKNNLSTKIEKLRKEISEKIDDSLHNITVDEIVDKSNELNNLIVEFHKQTKESS